MAHILNDVSLHRHIDGPRQVKSSSVPAPNARYGSCRRMVSGAGSIGPCACAPRAAPSKACKPRSRSMIGARSLRSRGSSRLRFRVAAWPQRPPVALPNGWQNNASAGCAPRIHPRHDASSRVARAIGLAPTDVVIDGELRWESPACRDRTRPVGVASIVTATGPSAVRPIARRCCPASSVSICSEVP